MTLALAVLQILTLLAVAALLLRRREGKDDPRVAALATDLPAQFARLEARLTAVDEHLRSNVAQLRADTSAEAQAGREAAERSAQRTTRRGAGQCSGARRHAALGPRKLPK